MCGRLTLKTAPDQLSQFLLPLVSEVQLPDVYQPRYNIAPTQTVLGIARGPNGNQIALYRWGLVPSWSTDFSIGNRMINARRETLLEKRSFKGPLARSRCLIVADGYYEWQQKTAKSKQAFWITPATSGIFLMAGLWEQNSRAGDRPIESCAVITTAANPAMSQIHDRMPMPLDITAALSWLEPQRTAEEAFELLRSPPENMFAYYPVSSFVNNARNEGPECIATVASSNE